MPVVKENVSAGRRPRRPPEPVWEAVPEPLRRRPQWVNWRFEWSAGKWAKIPYSPWCSRRASSTSALGWGSWEDARRGLKQRDLKQPGCRMEGVGFVFSRDDPFCGIDLDRCVTESGTILPWAIEIIAAMDSYTEFSQSKLGIHLLVEGALPPGRRKLDAIEMYTEGRFFVVTGDRVPGTMATIEARPVQLLALHGRVFGSQQQEAAAPPVVPRAVSSDDRALLDVGRQMKNGARFQQLFDHGDLSHYAGDDSAADLALCDMLAWLTDRDPARIDQLFRQSALYHHAGRPEKWDSRRGATTYGGMTIRKAIAGCREGYQPGGHGPGRNGGAPAANAAPGSNGSAPGGGEPESALVPRLVVVTERELDEKPIPPQEMVVDQILAAGLAVLGGKPKAGKTRLVSEIARAVAEGGLAFGKLVVSPGEVLYLALEDGELRLQERLRELRGDAPSSERLHLVTECPRADAGGLAALAGWLEERPAAKLVIVDTVVKIRPPRRPNSDIYWEDYALGSRLKELADRYGVCLLGLFHLRKAPAEDPFDTFSASLGLTAAADTLWVLQRARRQTEARLHVTGRAVADQELSLQADPHLRAWTLVGEAQDGGMSQQRKAILAVYNQPNEELTPQEVTLRLGKHDNGKIDPRAYNAVKYLMWQMNKDGVLHSGDGRYRVVVAAPNSENSPNSPNPLTQDLFSPGSESPVGTDGR